MTRNRIMVFLFRSYVFLLRLDIFLLRLNRYMKGSRLSLCFHALIVLIMLEKYMKTVIEVLYPHICISWCLLSSVYFLIFWPAMHCNAWLVSNLVWGVPSIKLFLWIDHWKTLKGSSIQAIMSSGESSMQLLRKVRHSRYQVVELLNLSTFLA